MNNQFNTPELQTLEDARLSAKKKMVTGIVFMAVSFVIEIVGLTLISLAYGDDTILIVGLLLVASTVPFWAMGIPFLITGIVGQAKQTEK